MAAPKDRWSVTTHGASVVQIWSAPTIDLDQEQHGRRAHQREHRGRDPEAPVIAGRGACSSRAARQTTKVVMARKMPTTSVTKRCRKWAICRLATAGSARERGHELAAEQRPVGEDEAQSRWRSRGTPNSSSAIHGERREPDEQRQSLARAVARQRRGIARADRQEDGHAEQDHRRGQVRRDRLAGVVLGDRDASRGRPGSPVSRSATIEPTRATGSPAAS